MKKLFGLLKPNKGGKEDLTSTEEEQKSHPPKDFPSTHTNQDHL